jgi:DNA-binding NarL/FixJ family response regulator
MGNSNHHITNREIEILLLISEGMKTKEIANNLFISCRTVNTHKTRLCNKLNLRSTAELSCYATSNREKLENYIVLTKTL